VREFLRKYRAELAAIQLPPGLRRWTAKIGKVFEEEGVEFVILGKSCYGACDLADKEAKQVGADVLVHYGHADMGLPASLPVLFVEARMLVNVTEKLEQGFEEIDSRRVGVVTTVQHVGELQKVRELLTSRGIEVAIGKPGFRARYPGQVLGCDMGSATSVMGEVDEFLYLGTGRFHPLGVALVTGKEVLTINPITGNFERWSRETESFLKKRRALVARAACCRRFGVVTSTKIGQARFKLARHLVEKLTKAGKDVQMILVDEVTPETLGDFGLDAVVCAACPRIPIDDAERFEIPLLTPFELSLVLGERWEGYRLDVVKAIDF